METPILVALIVEEAKSIEKSGVGVFVFAYRIFFQGHFSQFLGFRDQFSNANPGAWNSFLGIGTIFYGKLMPKGNKIHYRRYDYSTFDFKAPA